MPHERQNADCQARGADGAARAKADVAVGGLRQGLQRAPPEGGRPLASGGGPARRRTDVARMSAPEIPPRQVEYPPPEDPREAEDEFADEVQAQDHAADHWPAMGWALFDGRPR